MMAGFGNLERKAMADKWHYNGKIYRARLMFAWYDLWLGVFVDKDRRRVYVFPIPMFGVCFEFRRWFWSRDTSTDAAQTTPNADITGDAPARRPG